MILFPCLALLLLFVFLLLGLASFDLLCLIWSDSRNNHERLIGFSFCFVLACFDLYRSGVTANKNDPEPSIGFSFYLVLLVLIVSNDSLLLGNRGKNYPEPSIDFCLFCYCLVSLDLILTALEW